MDMLLLAWYGLLRRRSLVHATQGKGAICITQRMTIVLGTKVVAKVFRLLGTRNTHNDSPCLLASLQPSTLSTTQQPIDHDERTFTASSA